MAQHVFFFTGGTRRIYRGFFLEQKLINIIAISVYCVKKTSANVSNVYVISRCGYDHLSSDTVNTARARVIIIANCTRTIVFRNVQTRKLSNVKKKKISAICLLEIVYPYTHIALDKSY